jgi:hypothetical protein
MNIQQNYLTKERSVFHLHEHITCYTPSNRMVTEEDMQENALATQKVLP